MLILDMVAHIEWTVTVWIWLATERYKKSAVPYMQNLLKQA